MATPQEILQSMIDDADDQIGSIDAGMSQVDSQISDLNERIDGIQNGLCAVSETNLTTYLTDTKIPELEALHGGELPYVLTPGANYGSIDSVDGGITDWEILDNLGSLVYKYEGLNWDSDSTITNLIDDFAFGNDYLTKATGVSYGLIPTRDKMSNTKTMMERSRDKVSDSKTVLNKYT